MLVYGFPSFRHDFIVIDVGHILGVTLIFIIEFGVEGRRTWGDLVVSVIQILPLLFSYLPEQLVLFWCVILGSVVILWPTLEVVVPSFIEAGVQILHLFKGSKSVGQWVDLLVKMCHDCLEEGSTVGSSRCGWRGEFRWGIDSSQWGCWLSLLHILG